MIFELLLFEQKGEATLVRILLKMLKHTEKKALAIGGAGLYKYYSEAKFVSDTFAELSPAEIFS